MLYGICHDTTQQHIRALQMQQCKWILLLVYFFVFISSHHFCEFCTEGITRMNDCSKSKHWHFPHRTPTKSGHREEKNEQRNILRYKLYKFSVEEMKTVNRRVMKWKLLCRSKQIICLWCCFCLGDRCKFVFLACCFSQ